MISKTSISVCADTFERQYRYGIGYKLCILCYTELQISCVFAFFYAMETSKNACIIKSVYIYAYILLCKQTFQIRSILVRC